MEDTKRLAFNLIGLVFAGIGFIGAFLPVMPTTVFILAAAACFAKSSPRLHQALLNSRLFGSTLRAWEEQRCIPPEARVVAILSILVFGSLSFLFIESDLVRITLVALMLCGIGSIHYYSKRRPANSCPIKKD